MFARLALLGTIACNAWGCATAGLLTEPSYEPPSPFSFEVLEAGVTTERAGELWLYGRDGSSSRGDPWVVRVPLPRGRGRVAVAWQDWVRPREPARPLVVEAASAHGSADVGSSAGSPCSFLGFFRGHSTPVEVVIGHGPPALPSQRGGGSGDAPLLYAAPRIAPGGARGQDALVQAALDGFDGAPRFELVFLGPPNPPPRRWHLVPFGLLLDVVGVAVLPVVAPFYAVGYASYRESSTDDLARAYGRTNGCACVERGRTLGDSV